ncbi:hypothetical protein NQ318_014480 [Aromia moschata]|uniref:Mos1 transposase HTH domain-containing protein n=1 Tax=Aromia moschata TaxID=1265417 RepID=A0AAV8YKX9_9CUCU|nr:hypothetical protein NQ318_014480 [Aromia moschata]
MHLEYDWAVTVKCTYEVCKLSKETGNVAPYLATLPRGDLEERVICLFFATDTFAKFQHTYGDSVFSRAQVFRWFKAFSEGRDSIEGPENKH